MRFGNTVALQLCRRTRPDQRRPSHVTAIIIIRCGPRGEEGSWSLTLPILAPGVHFLQAALDAIDNDLHRRELHHVVHVLPCAPPLARSSFALLGRIAALSSIDPSRTPTGPVQSARTVCQTPSLFPATPQRRSPTNPV
ncbi:hypothetical protein BC567DRAFT_57618 [Phyllosticta citribraziliensis]